MPSDKDRSTHPINTFSCIQPEVNQVTQSKTQHRKLPRAFSSSHCLLSRDLINSLELITRASTPTGTEKDIHVFSVQLGNLAAPYVEISLFGALLVPSCFLLQSPNVPILVSLRLDSRRQQLLPLWLSANPLTRVPRK